MHKAEEPLLKWEKSEFFIPALYVGLEGAVLDLCMRVPLSEISAGELTIQDCAKSDPPRKKNVLPAQEDGVTAYFLASTAAVVPRYPESGTKPDGFHEAGGQKVWAACSALRFEPVDRVEWKAVFHIQERENFHITAVLS